LVCTSDVVVLTSRTPSIGRVSVVVYFNAQAAILVAIRNVIRTYFAVFFGTRTIAKNFTTSIVSVIFAIQDLAFFLSF